MPPLKIFDALSPHVRVATAVAPFVVAAAARLLLGRSRFTGVLMFLATAWFAINVFLAPYSAGMQQDVRNLGRVFR